MDIIDFFVKYRPKLHVIKVVWKPTLNRRIVCNTDGASRGNLDSSAYGFPLRYTVGNLIYVESHYFGIAANMEAEARVLCQALSYCRSNGLVNVQVQTDPLVLKQMVTKELRILWEMIEIMEDIHRKMYEMQVEMVHIYREANKLADHIVNEGFQHEDKLPFNQFSDLPSMTRKLLNMDGI